MHASFGRAGATKRITVGHDSKHESVVLDAGGLELNAMLAGGKRIRLVAAQVLDLRSKPTKAAALIIQDVSPNTVVRLNSGNYQVVSNYGTDNAVIRSDVKVEAGKLIEVTVEHHAAELTIKLVREPGGEAMADTSWSVLTDSGDPVRDHDVVGAYASMVLAEGDYTVIAKNRDKLYQRISRSRPAATRKSRSSPARPRRPTQADEAD